MEIAYDGQGTHPERVFTLLIAFFFQKVIGQKVFSESRSSQ